VLVLHEGDNPHLTSLVLQLGEAIVDGLFDECATYELVGLIASISGDPHRSYFKLKSNPIKNELYAKMRAIVERIRGSYQGPGGVQELEVLPGAALTFITWMDAESWGEFSGLLRLRGIADGDIAWLVSQTAGHLNQPTQIEKTHPALVQAAVGARARLLRPPFSDTVAVAVVA
jgi:hypothetical protein